MDNETELTDLYDLSVLLYGEDNVQKSRRAFEEYVFFNGAEKTEGEPYTDENKLEDGTSIRAIHMTHGLKSHNLYSVYSSFTRGIIDILEMHASKPDAVVLWRKIPTIRKERDIQYDCDKYYLTARFCIVQLNKSKDGFKVLYGRETLS